MSTAAATIWFIAMTITILLVIGLGIMMAARVIHPPHLHLPHRHH